MEQKEIDALPEIPSRKFMWFDGDKPFVVWDKDGRAWQVGVVSGGMKAKKRLPTVIKLKDQS